MTNATNFNNQFVPLFYARRAQDNRFVLGFNASISSNMDNGTTPMMIFTAERDDTVYPNAPTGATFPWGNAQDGLSFPINNRPLFAWNNSSIRIMTISAQNNLGIGASLPTARLHTNGTVRFENIPTVTSNTYVLTADANGNISRQLSSSLGGMANSCNTTNFILRQVSGGLTCSQIYDNGTNVGIGTTSPGNKLTVNGNIQSLSNTFLSDKKFKKNINSIDNALETILKLTGTTYNWKKEEFKDFEFSSKLQYGLIAQDVEKVIPELVDVSSDNDYSLNYTALIPILIEAIKQQQEQIITLQEQVNTNFQKQNFELINFKNTKIINVYPNPSSDTVIVSLNIEETVKDAKLIIYDLNGNIMSSLSVKERNYDIKKSLQKDNFGSGTYIISLFVNGKSLDTKKIIFN